MTQLIFDGHNNVLSRLAQTGDAAAFASEGVGHVNLVTARKGGFAGGFFAIWARSDMAMAAMDAETARTPYDLALSDPLDRSAAWAQTGAQADILLQLQGTGALRICTTVAEIETARAQGRIAAIFHIEGAEAIGPDLSELDMLHAMGLRSLGPVWSRPNIFGHGVPFRYPSDGDTGPGLSEEGRALVARCNALGIMIDLSHLTARGVADVAGLSDAPLVATHSNAHAICPHARNLTDTQLALIARSGGLVGLNFERSFLRPDGLADSAVPVDVVLAHLDHLLAQLGEEGVALGSDFDGFTLPDWLGSAADLPVLVRAMERHGYSAARIERICWANWMRVLDETWH
ncbi:MAG: dipeptidase [Rhodobacteraceae bacterium]|nr:dipeptidase [Paracoccaceae bacterium]